jgi:DNA-binding MarR family transcriptional regulator
MPYRLLRYSHILASAVREVLELRLLREASPLALTLSQFHLLRLMTYNGEHQIGEVAHFLGVSPPAATKNIDKLERFGLVVRSRSRGDRRATLLSVSSAGRGLVRKYEALKTGRLSSLLDEFQPEEIQQFCTFLERFSVALLKLEPSGSRFCLRCAAYLESDCPVGRLRGGCPYQSVRTVHVGEGADAMTP